MILVDNTCHYKIQTSYNYRIRVWEWWQGLGNTWQYVQGFCCLEECFQPSSKALKKQETFRLNLNEFSLCFSIPFASRLFEIYPKISSIHPSIYPSIHPFIHPSIHPSIVSFFHLLLGRMWYLCDSGHVVWPCFVYMQICKTAFIDLLD
jgi:hypothetical protein